MKFRIIIAFLCFFTGTAKIIDWFFFWNQNKALALESRDLFMHKYIERFPVFLQSLFGTKFPLDTILCIVFFSAAGLLFLKEKKKGYTVMAILSFILAFWNLFSLM